MMNDGLVGTWENGQNLLCYNSDPFPSFDLQGVTFPVCACVLCVTEEYNLLVKNRSSPSLRFDPPVVSLCYRSRISRRVEHLSSIAHECQRALLRVETKTDVREPSSGGDKTHRRRTMLARAVLSATNQTSSRHWAESGSLEIMERLCRVRAGLVLAKMLYAQERIGNGRRGSAEGREKQERRCWGRRYICHTDCSMLSRFFSCKGVFPQALDY